MRRWALPFECAIEDAVARFMAGLPAGERVLAAEAGEGGGFEVMRVKHFSWRDDPAGLATSLASKRDAGYFAPVANVRARCFADN